MTISDSYVAARYAEIAALIDDLETRTAADGRLAAHMAGYLDVLVVGLVEDAIEHLLGERAARTGDAEIASYVRNRVAGAFRNPDWGAISGLLGQLSSKYKTQFASQIPSEGQVSETLRSLLANKHASAHVGTTNLYLTIPDIRNYLQRLEELFESVESILLP